MPYESLALVGAVGGAGTTRTVVECGATLARTGHDVVILDAAFATQGLSTYMPGRIDTDLTHVIVEDEPLEECLTPLTNDLPGALQAAPARAPFERVARAKTAGAADRLERRISAAASEFDIVLVDTPPVAANQAVAAVTTTDRVAVVAPATRRGADGLARIEGVLVDIGTASDGTVATFSEKSDAIPSADARLPASDVMDATECPSSIREGAPLAEPCAAAVETLFDLTLSLDLEDSAGFERYLP